MSNNNIYYSVDDYSDTMSDDQSQMSEVVYEKHRSHHKCNHCKPKNEHKCEKTKCKPEYKICSCGKSHKEKERSYCNCKSKRCSKSKKVCSCDEECSNKYVVIKIRSCK